GAVEATIRKLNVYFRGRADLSDPLDCHIQASLVAHGPRAERVDRLRVLLSYAAGPARPAGGAPAGEPAAALQRALLQWRAVDAELAVTILTELPESLPVLPEISELAAQQLAYMSEKPTPELIDLLGR